jgi:hypothetical protein
MFGGKIGMFAGRIGTFGGGIGMFTGHEAGGSGAKLAPGAADTIGNCRREQLELPCHKAGEELFGAPLRLEHAENQLLWVQMCMQAGGQK